MTVTSKFENLYLLRIVFIPLLCIGFVLLLLDVKIDYNKNIDIIFPIIILSLIACLVLLYNLNSIYKIIVDETTITKIYFLSGKKEIIPFESIISLTREHIEGGYSSEVGKISDGYYEYVFSLVNDKKLVVSPLCFNNYKELISNINQNRNIQSPNSVDL